MMFEGNLKMTVVTEKCIKGVINGKVRHLKKSDYGLQVRLPSGCKPELIVTRYGNTEALSISRRVAEELIAAGVSFGN